MAALVVIAAIIGVFVFLQRGDARQEETDLTENLSKSKSALQARELEKVDAEEQIRALEESVPSELGPFPSKSFAQELSIRLTEYVATPDREVRVNSFVVNQEGTLTLSDTEYPTISYDIEARGPKNSLIGALDLLDEYPTAVVHRLDFNISLEDPDMWGLGLTLDVVYEFEPGTGS